MSNIFDKLVGEEFDLMRAEKGRNVTAAKGLRWDVPGGWLLQVWTVDPSGVSMGQPSFVFVPRPDDPIGPDLGPNLLGH